MENQTKLIADRLKWARENAELSAADMAVAADVTEAKYAEYESGNADFSFTFLYKCARKLQMDISELVSGSDPKLSFYNVTRGGEGMPIRRRAGFGYRHVAPFLKNRLSEPFVVTVPYNADAEKEPIPLSTHKGQEMDYVLSGSMRVQLDDHTEVLNAGDSVYYDSAHRHGMIAVGGTDCVFLAIVFKEPSADITAAEPVPSIRAKKETIDRHRYDGLIYHQFCDETFDDEGRLKDISFHYPENFNFGYDVIDALARKIPEKRALLWLSHNKEQRDFTFAELSALSNRVANYFLERGIRRGDRVMLVLKRHYQFWLSILALHKIGAVALPATSQLVQKDYEYRFKAAGVKAIVCTADGDCANQVELAEAASPSLKLKFLVGGKRDGWFDFDGEYMAYNCEMGRQETAADDDAIMFFTSGTTGYPKVATHSATYALGHIVTARHWHNVDPDGIHLTISDTGWGKALWGKLYGQWLCEGTVFVYDFEKFNADDILPLFKQHHITTFCAPPTMYRFLIKEDLAKYDLSMIQYATVAGEALNPEVFYQFCNATGLELKEGFGQTETTLTIGNLYGYPVKVGSMGRPNPQYNVRLVDEAGKDVRPGEVGEICVDTSKGVPVGLYKGYYQMPEKTAETWHDGLYHTGDTAWCDEDGYFWYVGRTDDVIKSSGYRIGPFEIESVIMELPYVLECAITGTPDPTRGQVVKATIVLTKGTIGTEELKKDIQMYVKKHTAPYKYPRVVEFVDELPKTISGKIRRVDLRK